MAYFAEHLVQGICLYTAGRKPKGRTETNTQLDYSLGLYRTLARRLAKLPFVGIIFRSAAYHRKFVLMRFLNKLPAFIQHIYALFLICIGWVIFYFEDLGQLWSYLCSLFNPEYGLIASDAFHIVMSYLPLLVVAVLASTPLAFKLYQKLRDWRYIWIPETGLCLGGLLICTASLVSQSYNPFIYFRF